MARRVLSFAVLAVLVLALRWSATAFLPTGKPLLRGGAAGALATTAAAAGAMPALAEEEGGLLNFGKVELGGGFALNLNIPDINLVNISILVAGLFYFLGPLLSESMASREKEIQSDIDDAIAKYNEASTRLAEAKKAKEQADAVVKEINDSIAKDIKEFQSTLNARSLE
ncbi:atpF [Symbiodinium sp. CCMP2592]|nr:atpF [Symbiodinium sp. CCMP2592]